jgi:hypothetical protein
VLVGVIYTWGNFPERGEPRVGDLGHQVWVEGRAALRGTEIALGQTSASNLYPRVLQSLCDLFTLCGRIREAQRCTELS